MGEGDKGQSVLVLTDSPWDYEADMRRLGLAPRYVPSVALLLDHLRSRPASGFVLEVGKVMRASDPGRNQIFQLSRVFPVLRVLRRGLERELAYVDDPDRFVASVQACPPRKVRHSGRVLVGLRGLLAQQGDEAFASPVRANILDLSHGGGFVSIEGDFPFGEKVLLRIEDMEDRTPILSSIRWRKGLGNARSWCGVGLSFLDIRPGQIRELLARFLTPAGGLDLDQAEPSCP